MLAKKEKKVETTFGNQLGQVSLSKPLIKI